MRPPPRPLAAFAATAIASLLATGCARSPEPVTVRVAVASNFAGALDALAAAFRTTTGIELRVTAGATGKLYAQIHNGAPFDVLLAADAARPERLEEEGLGVAGTRFAYALGRLALVGPSVDPDDGVATLREGAFAHLAIANPKTAPYGLAATAVLDALDLRDTLAPKLVLGENVGQTMQFVDSGAAELGLVALSQVVARDGAPRWIVPADLHAPIRQEAVLLRDAAHTDAARAFLAFLRSPAARDVLRAHGYEAGDE